MTDTTFDPDSFLSGGSVAAKWPEVGFTVEGTVLGFTMSQRTHIDSGELLFWEARKAKEESKLASPTGAKPVMQLLLDLQCEPTGITWETNRYIEKAIPDDDGKRTAYVYGGLQRAVSKALKDAGSRVEKGAYVKITRGQDVKVTGSQYFSYTYTAVWTPAAKNDRAAQAFASQDANDDPWAT